MGKGVNRGEPDRWLFVLLLCTSLKNDTNTCKEQRNNGLEGIRQSACEQGLAQATDENFISLLTSMPLPPLEKADL